MQLPEKFSTHRSEDQPKFAYPGFSEVRCGPLRRAADLPILPTAYSVFESVLVLQAVGHVSSYEGEGLLL
jgi:hypothetical protein